jgi:hypothetical protein
VADGREGGRVESKGQDDVRHARTDSCKQRRQQPCLGQRQRITIETRREVLGHRHEFNSIEPGMCVCVCVCVCVCGRWRARSAVRTCCLHRILYGSEIAMGN